jgi:hypothetical protein
MSDTWVIFDGWGVQVFFTREEQYANLNNMSDSEYNKGLCSIVLNVPGYTGVGRRACQKDMTSGVITIIERPRGYSPAVPHIPAP